MCKLSLSIENSEGVVLGKVENESYVNLVYGTAYQNGDIITFEVSQPNQYFVIQLDDVMNPAFVYMKEKVFKYSIPFEEKKLSYPPKSFTGELHLLKARLATKAEVEMYKNLACNEYDSHGNTACFPHAYANVETRGESVFAARNAINGNTENHGHGIWPYESWGINSNPNAEITVDFGRTVEIDKVVLVTRADFPHDNWWNSVTVTFSDGESLVFSMKKSDQPHEFSFPKRKAEWLRLEKLIRDTESESPFPALTQVEVYGIG